MQIEKIYFDMDGVLVDFNKGVRELGGFEGLDQCKASKEKDEQLWNAVRSVDDFSMNIEEWNASGGTGILYKDAEGVIKAFEMIAAS